jgi:hypothetical protein
MKRILREVIWVVCIVGLSIFTVSFWQGLPFGWVFQPILFFALLLTVFGFSERAIALAMVGGFLLDTHSALPFGVFTAACVFSLAAVFFSQETFFTERAIHTVMVHVFVGTVIFGILFFGISRIAQLAGVIGSSLDLTLVHVARIGLVEALVHMGLTAMVYSCTVLFRYRFIHATV